MYTTEIDLRDDARSTFLRESQSELDEIRQRERLKWFAERLESRTDYHSVEELVEKFSSSVDWPGQREKAVALLALKGSVGALRALEDLDMSQASNSLHSLYSICLKEARARVFRGSVTES